MKGYPKYGLCKQVMHTSTAKIKSFIYLRRIIDSDARKKIDGEAVATARFSDAAAEQSDK